MLLPAPVQKAANPYAQGPPDGFGPVGGVVRDSKGNLSGTTSMGGTGNCNGGYGCSTVFEVTASGRERVLYSFTGQSEGRRREAAPFQNSDDAPILV